MNPINPMIDPKHAYIAVYLLLWVSRLRGFQRRWQQPRLRGTGWFFDTPVERGFYDGPAKALLQRYAWRMALPCLIDAIALLGYYVMHDDRWLLGATLLLVPAIHLNHMLNVARSQREAQPWAVKEEIAPAVAVGLSLKPRRLRDYTNRTVEAVFAAGSILPFFALLHIYTTVAGRHNLRMVFWLPVVCLYLQLGVLLLKWVIVTWRAPVPMVQSAEHVEIRETMRRYYLLMCDWNRGAAIAGIVFWPFVLAAPERFTNSLLASWSVVWLSLTVVGAVWIEVRRKQLAMLGLKAKPVRLPDLSQSGTAARWPLCWQRDVPLLVLGNEWGYSLNLGHSLAFVSVVYLAGMAALILSVQR